MILDDSLNISFIKHFLHGIQELLGDQCEIIVHDFREGFDKSIVYAINSELSNRTVGGKPRGALIMNFGKDIEPIKSSKVFFYKGEKGQVFKSSSTLLADSNNKVVGSICVNIEISQLLGANAILGDFLTGTQSTKVETDQSALMAQNVDDVLEHYISSCEQLVGKSMPLMDKEEKIKALKFLDERGVFKISKANVLLCERFQVSKYTLYNYLDEARKDLNHK